MSSQSDTIKTRNNFWHTFIALLFACQITPTTAQAQNPQTQIPADNSGGQQTQTATVPLRFPGEAIFNANPPFLTGVAVDQKDRRYREGQKLKVQFMAEKDAYLYLIYHQADGSSLLLFPNFAERVNRVAAGQPIVVPASEKDVRFRVQAPFGEEVLQVIASVEPIAELNGLLGGAAVFPQVTPELLGQLAERLKTVTATWTEHRVPLLTEAAAKPSSPSPAKRIGLFIGIGRYANPKLAATHDELGQSAVAMHDLLLKQGRLDPSNTRLVVNEQATKANLEELIVRWLPSVSQPGDTVFLYFSGHAGQFAADDTGEPSRQERMIGPYDLNAGSEDMPVAQRMAIYRQSSVSSRTLARWLQELSGRQIVCIFDTCHSGGLFREKAVKNLTKDFLVSESKQLKAVAQMNMLVLSSCAEDEQSLFEGTRNKTMWFTYCLTEAIEVAELPRPLTVQAAFEYSKKRMRELLREGNAGREQEPQMIDTALLPIDLIPVPSH